jgi:hypothetical protein
VSLPWSKVVRLRVRPNSAGAKLERGWPRRRVLARASHTATDAAEPQPAPADNMSRAIDAVLAELGKTATLRGARLEVAWADALMHFDVVAGDFVGNSDRELQTVATACVAELLGESAPAHEIRWQLQADGKHLLIGAIEREHLRTLSEAAARHGLKLTSVQPDFCLQWNRHSHAVAPGACVFAVASGHDAVIACVADGTVAAVSRGAWLARAHQPGNSTVAVNKLMHGLGLEPSAKEVLLDIRVDRLLASIGLDAASQSAFVLVAPEMAGTKVSARWTLFNRDARPT